MRKRTNLVKVYLSDEEAAHFEEWVEATKLSKSNYLRQLIMGFQPIAFPPIEYTDMMEELRKVGVNMNQLAVKANSLGFIDEPEYRKNAQVVWDLCAEMARRLGKKSVKFGSH